MCVFTIFYVGYVNVSLAAAATAAGKALL